ncbi:MAG TPA: helix-turn-helix domain-containing protein [Streptosporangiaceae bacterium]|nr:helix-turn-helix domain-containing protein [Streptosporangiaceae bacterium]
MPAAAAEIPQLLTVPQTAERLQVHPNTVFTLIASGALKSVKVRGSRRIPAEALAEYVAGLST